MQTLCWAGRRLAGGFAGCAGGELVEITSQLHRALPRLAQLQWEVPADYSGWLNHPSITWNFHTQPSINISPPTIKEEKYRNYQYFPSPLKIIQPSLVFCHHIMIKIPCFKIIVMMFIPSLCFMVESIERWRFI